MSTVGSKQNPLNIAIIGSGPSGFYATDALLKSDRTINISMFEKLPIPYGLVRSGVAPDHPKLKRAIDVYAKIAEAPEFTFFGNVTIGKDLSIDEIRSHFHALILTCGTESDRKLNIPGEDLGGSHTATEFVGWYNGHPDYRDRTFDLSHETAVIIGQGNVAADVGRILAKTPDELKHTDIAEHAFKVLAESKIRNIHVIGRRGPAQAKFTSKELKEFGELADCHTIVNPNELLLNTESSAELEEKTNAVGKKVYELFESFSAQENSSPKKKRIHFTFLKSPIRVTGNNIVEKIDLEINKLSGEPFNQSATGTGKNIHLDTGIVFRSIGYRGLPITGVPFDDKRGIIPNNNGRVTDGATIVPYTYVAGWIKRGPTGIIGTNRADSVETVQSLIEDFDKSSNQIQNSGAEGARSILDAGGIHYVSFSDWKKIDQNEIDRGIKKGKPREKYTYVQEIMSILK